MRKKSLFILFISLIGTFYAKAEHILGGEISYKFIEKDGSSYRYLIQVKIYRDCGTFFSFDPAIELQISNKTFYRKVLVTDIKKSNIQLNKIPYCVINEPKGCVEQAVYEYTVSLPQSNEGYHLFYTSCCRNEFSTNILTNEANRSSENQNGLIVPGQGFTYAAFIPSYNQAEINSSPISNIDSAISICANKPFQYQFRYSDPDNDVLKYKLCESYGVMKDSEPPFSRSEYANGFSGKNPIPGVPSLTIDENTGLLWGTPTKEGFYTIVLCIEEYRNNVLINTHRREQQLNVISCDIQAPKDVINCESEIAMFTNANRTDNLFQWNFGVDETSDDISDRIFPTYRYPRDGNFTVQLKAVNPRLGCEDSITASAKIFRGLQNDFTWVDPICNGEPIQLKSKVSTPFGTISEYKWELINNRTIVGNTPDITYTYSVPNNDAFPFSFQLTVTTDLGCKKTTLKVVEVLPLPNAYAGPDTIIAFNEPYVMQGAGGSIYSWQPTIGLSNPNIAKPVLTINKDQVYVLKVGRDRCVDYDTVSIRYMKGPEVYIPNAFSPNNDGLNDIFRITPVNIKVEKFYILNQWGQILYASTKLTEGWDGKHNGKPQPADTYIWSIEARDAEDKMIYKKGTFQLIR